MISHNVPIYTAIFFDPPHRVFSMSPFVFSLFLSVAFAGRKKSRPIFFEKALQLLFVAAELFLAARAIKALVCSRRKSLGMPTVGDLPTHKERDRTSKQTVCV